MMTEVFNNDKGQKAVVENLIVALRIRPISEDEIINGATPIAHKVDEKMVVLMDPSDDPDDVLRANRSREKRFLFDRTMDGSATQKEVYEQTSKNLIPGVVSGYNATVFAYGATGAGKTYTMLGTDDDPGIMARTLTDLFEEMDRTQDVKLYRVSMSYLEIYNEMIRDLLNPGAGYLELREDANGVQVAGLSAVTTKTTGEVMKILMRGNLQRTQEPTAANRTSSRSHAVMQITVKQRCRIRNANDSIRVGKLFLIDLAGSERAANTQNRGRRMVEGAHINRSLLALGNCINALSEKNSHRYVNYRDSKLTRLLKDALGGNCKTVMIAHISPASLHFEESRNTLVYADRAKNIKTKVRQNVLDVSYHIAQYTNIIAELREEIMRLRHKLDEKSLANQATVAYQHNDYPKSNAEQAVIGKLKEQLLTVFKDQMVVRRSLLELNTNAMEISLETSRNQLLIKKWEREKGIAEKRKELSDDNKYRDVEKESEMDAGLDVSEPEEVRQAREEIQNLEVEKSRTEGLKANLQKELDTAKNAAAKIEQTLPKKVRSAEHKEILSLLCKVHELEIENMQMQSSCLLRSFEIRKRDMVISHRDQQRRLCEEIIIQQRALIEESQLPYPKDLHELYDLYQQELGEVELDHSLSLPDINAYKNQSVVNVRRENGGEMTSDLESVSTTHLPRIHVATSGANSIVRKHVLQRSSHNFQKFEEEDPFFSKSPFAKELRESNGLRPSRASNSAVASPPDVSGRRQKSIITLSSRSTTTTPSPPADSSHKLTTGTPAAVTSDDSVTPRPLNREVIAHSTRNIAALAARRRTRFQQDAASVTQQDTKLGMEHSMGGTFVSVPGTSNVQQQLLQLQKLQKHGRPPGRRESAGVLTESRLAQHDQRYDLDGPVKRIGKHVDDDDDLFSRSSVGAPLTVPVASVGRGQHRALYRNSAVKKNYGGSRRGGKRAKPTERASYQQMTPEAFFRQLAKNSPRKALELQSSHASMNSDTRVARRSRLPAPIRPRAHVPKGVAIGGKDFNLDKHLITMETTATPPTSVSQIAPEKGKGLTLQKRTKGSVSQTTPASSVASTPPDSKSKAPSIPAYHKGDISVTGQSVAQSTAR